ncbi:MAG: phytanoyl-CoA dioxygenase family protein [Bacteroidia bacterium]
MKTVFKNDLLQQQFEKEGYVVVPFLNAEQVQQLGKTYSELPYQNINFSSSSYFADLDFKRQLDAKNLETLQPVAENLLQEIKILGTSFLTKKTGNETAMPIHQDWTVVDEKKYFSATVWIPLQDTTLNNGAIQVIPGSHKFSDALRSPSLKPAFAEIYNKLYPYLKLIPMKAGEAFIFNHTLMHASSPNVSKENRVVVTLGFTNKEAQLLMYYNTKGTTIEKYIMPDDMFIRYPEIKEKPSIGKLIDTFEYVVPQIDINTFRKQVQNRTKNLRMEPLFRNEENQKFFEENGYLKLPVLNEEEIQKLKDFYFNAGLKDEMGYGFYVGMDSSDKKMVRKMVETIKEIAMPKIQLYLHNTQVFTASFVVKEANPKGVVPPHQDWSFVENEVDHCSLTCWIPLQDVNMENGCMGVVKGSNKFFNSVRPSPSPQVATPLKSHMFTIFPYLQLIEMKAGEALFFDNRTFHASPPNTSNAPRLAVGLGFTQTSAEIRHYYLKPGTDNVLMKYKIDGEFFFKYDNSLLSKMYNEGKLIEGYELLEEIPHTWEDLSADELKQMMKDAGNTFNIELVEKMATLFNYNLDGTAKNQEPVPTEQEVNEPVMADTTKALPFWKIYTPLNVMREIKHRLTKY